MRACSLVLALILVVGAATAQNSTRKVRTPPGEVAAKAGSAVPWHEDVATALAAGKQSGKPVFWYVPSVAGSPMDRKPEIDRYLRGGPFSWPTTVLLLQENFECVAAVAAGDLQGKYDLRRNVFLEPGYLVLDARGELLAKVDQITTLHPQWFEAPLRRLVNKPREGFPCDPQLREVWAAYRQGDYDAVTRFATRSALLPAAERHVHPHTHLELLWLRGCAALRAGDAAGARAAWTELAEAEPVEGLPPSPLVAKAALELEGHGPFGRGFEVYGELPDAVLTKDPHDGTRAPAGTYNEAELWQRSVQFLLSAHDGRGVYRDSQYDFGGTDSLPNVHAAVTCLAGMALLAAEPRVDAALRPRVAALLDTIRANAEAEAWLALSDKDEILWARAYALRFLAAWHTRRDADRAALRPALQHAAGAVLALQPETGVWFHEYGNPFAIATALQALYEARRVGVTVDQEKIDKGLRALAQNRTEQGAFSYGHTRRGPPRATVEAAAGRMPLCELALHLFDASSDERLAAAVDAGFAHHGLLAAVRKYDDHADRHGYGGFFFWFDMLGRVEASARLADAAARQQRLATLRQQVLALPEFDGCFVDSHELGRVYGTAMALLCLDRCAL